MGIVIKSNLRNICKETDKEKTEMMDAGVARVDSIYGANNRLI